MVSYRNMPSKSIFNSNWERLTRRMLHFRQVERCQDTRDSGHSNVKQWGRSNWGKWNLSVYSTYPAAGMSAMQALKTSMLSHNLYKTFIANLWDMMFTFFKPSSQQLSFFAIKNLKSFCAENNVYTGLALGITLNCIEKHFIRNVYSVFL